MLSIYHRPRFHDNLYKEGCIKLIKETYISVDVETVGPVPPDYSMISLGAAAFDSRGTFLGGFQENLKPIPGSLEHPDTMAWWKTQPEAWKAATTNPKPPLEAMLNFISWVNGFPGKPVFVAYPAGFDFQFVYYYMQHYTKQSPFGFSALDIKTYAMAKLAIPYRQSVKSNFPKEWYKGITTKHTHIASDDAREQGELFFNIRRYVGENGPYN